MKLLQCFNLGRKIVVAVPMMLLFLLGMVAGGAIGDIPTPVTAQAPGEEEGGGGGGGGGSTCEDDACVKYVKRWWFDSWSCEVSPNSGTGCNLTGGDPPCENYQCDD